MPLQVNKNKFETKIDQANTTKAMQIFENTHNIDYRPPCP